MHYIYALLIHLWKELETDLSTKTPSYIKITEYTLKGSYPDLPTTSYKCHIDFIDAWANIIHKCTKIMKSDVDTIFMVGNYFELPRSASSVFDVACALSPESCRKISVVAQRFDIESYVVHFEPSQQGSFENEADFKQYSQIWIEHFIVAASTGSGIVFIYQ